MKPVKYDVLCIIAGVLLALFVTEGLLQLTDRNSYNKFLNDPETGLLVYSPHTSYIASTPCYKNEVSINNFGFYGSDYQKDKPENVFRIIVTGSSFVEALQVPIKEQFTRLLEEKLNSNTKNNVRFEVIPFGFSGNGTYLNLLYFINYAKFLQPDLVVNVMTDYDLVQDAEYAKHPPRFDEDGSLILELNKTETGGATVFAKNVFRKSKLFMNVYGKYLLIKASLNHAPIVEERDMPEGELHLDTIWETEEKIFSSFNDNVAEQQSRFLVVSWSDDDHVRASEDIATPLRDIAEHNGFLYYDLKPPLLKREQYENISPIWPCDGHWNATGHRWVADALASFLIEQTNVLAPK